MKKIIGFILAYSAGALLLYSCDRLLNPFDSPYGGELGIGDKDISYIELGYPRDLEDFTGGRKGGKTGYGDLVMLIDSSRFARMDYDGGTVDVSSLEASNVIDYDWESVEMVAVYRPSDAYLQSVSVTSSDTSVVSVSKGTVPMGFRVKINGVGECDLRMTAVGNETLRRTYHMKVTEELTLKIYMDPFWMNNLTARIKYRCKSLPRGIDRMFLNVRDSVTVIGQARVMDQRRGDSDYRIVSDTTVYRLREHTDRFRKNRRVILRNVSDAVRKYNAVKKESSYIRVSGYGSEGAGKRYVQQDGKWFVVEDAPYECRQVRLGLDVISDSPYLLFNVVMKKSQTPSSSDEDEEDSDDSPDTDDEELKDYFVIQFNENMKPSDRDSLSRRLHELVNTQPDSLKWILSY